MDFRRSVGNLVSLWRRKAPHVAAAEQEQVACLRGSGGAATRGAPFSWSISDGDSCLLLASAAACRESAAAVSAESARASCESRSRSKEVRGGFCTPPRAPGGAAHAVDGNVENELVARLHWPLEARAVDAGEVHDGLLVQHHVLPLHLRRQRLGVGVRGWGAGPTSTEWSATHKQSAAPYPHSPASTAPARGGG